MHPLGPPFSVAGARHAGPPPGPAIPWGEHNVPHPVDDRPGAFDPPQRLRLLRERGRRCAWCGWSPSGHGGSVADLSPAGPSTALQVDHVVPIHFGGGAGNGNAAVLCDACHAAKTAVEGTVTRSLPQHFGAGTHPAGGAGGWYVRGGAGWAPPWEVGPAPTALGAMLAYHAWACDRLRELAGRGWDDPLLRAWRAAPERPAGGIGPSAADLEPTPFHATWGALAGLRGVDAARLAGEAAHGLLLELARRHRTPEAGCPRTLPVRFWRRDPEGRTVVTGWCLLGPERWLSAQPLAPPGPPAPAPAGRRGATRPGRPIRPHPPVRRPTTRPRWFASPAPGRG